MGICVMLLAYKEEENLRVLLPKIIEQMDKLPERYSITVIDTEEPTDNTSDVCREYGARYVNQRYPKFGGAFRTAIEEASADKFLILDSDGSHDPKYIPDIYKLFTEGRYDVVIGSRYTKGGSTNDAKSSQIMSHMLNFAYGIVLGINAKDLSTDYRMYRTKQLKRLNLTCQNYDVLEETLLKLKIDKKKLKGKKLRVGEVPIHFEKRMYGESKRQLIPFIIDYIKTLFRLLGLRVKSTFAK